MVSFAAISIASAMVVIVIGVVCSDFHRVRHGCDSDLESGETDLL
jgi:hypothetical protein